MKEFVVKYEEIGFVCTRVSKLWIFNLGLKNGFWSDKNVLNLLEKDAMA